MNKQDAADFGRTVRLLAIRGVERTDTAPFSVVADAQALHRIAGSLHRIAERECNEDLTCQACGGEGRVTVTPRGPEPLPPDFTDICRKCKGEGTTVGPRLVRLRKQASELAEHYGLRCYFQTDPRGCPLWLIDPATVPSTAKDLDRYQYDMDRDFPGIATLQERWIDSNYTRGHAVVWIGR